MLQIILQIALIRAQILIQIIKRALTVVKIITLPLIVK